MKYSIALQKIVSIFLRNQGGFYKPLPSMENGLAEEAESILLERAREMMRIAGGDELGMGDLIRFNQELHVVAFLYIMAVIGKQDGEVPLSAEDIGDFEGTVMCQVTAGVPAEAGKEILDIARRVIAKATALGLITDDPLQRFREELTASLPESPSQG